MRRDLARRAFISESYLSDILHRRRKVGQKMALNLSRASVTLKPIPSHVWLENLTSKHPAFF